MHTEAVHGNLSWPCAAHNTLYCSWVVEHNMRASNYFSTPCTHPPNTMTHCPSLSGPPALPPPPPALCVSLQPPTCPLVLPCRVMVCSVTRQATPSPAASRSWMDRLSSQQQDSSCHQVRTHTHTQQQQHHHSYSGALYICHSKVSTSAPPPSPLLCSQHQHMPLDFEGPPRSSCISFFSTIYCCHDLTWPRLPSLSLLPPPPPSPGPWPWRCAAPCRHRPPSTPQLCPGPTRRTAVQ